MRQSVLPVFPFTDGSSSEDGSRREPASLRKTTRDGDPLRRPPEVEREIAAALEWSADRILARAAIDDPEAEGYMSSECLVHLIRRDAGGERVLVEDLAPLLLARCAGTLRGAVRGFSGAARDDVHAEILGRLAELLVDPGADADFFEVRFARAFKCLTIDVCRVERRRAERFPALGRDETATESDELERLAAARVSPIAGAEAGLDLKEALASLDDQEREVLVLHRLMGVRLNARRDGDMTVVRLLGCSERTARNRLRRAEAKIAVWREGRS